MSERADCWAAAEASEPPAITTTGRRAQPSTPREIERVATPPGNDDRKPATVTTTSCKRTKLLRADKRAASTGADPEVTALVKAFAARAVHKAARAHSFRSITQTEAVGTRHLYMNPHRTACLVGVVLAWTTTGLAATPPPDSPAAQQEAEKLAHLPPVAARGHIDHSGRKQQGRASYYARHFANRKMADGQRFNPNSNAAASKTLPFGTTAKVTNLKNGRSALVTVEDRGPHVGGRIVDVTPKVADELDMKKASATPVVVSPIAVPQPDGAVKLGAGAVEVTTQELRTATQIANAFR